MSTCILKITSLAIFWANTVACISCTQQTLLAPTAMQVYNTFLLAGPRPLLLFTYSLGRKLWTWRSFYELIYKIQGSNLHIFLTLLVDKSSKSPGVRVELCSFLMETSAKADVSLEELFYMLLSHEKKQPY